MGISNDYANLTTLQRIGFIGDGDKVLIRALIKQAINQGYLEKKTIKYWEKEN